MNQWELTLTLAAMGLCLVGALVCLALSERAAARVLAVTGCIAAALSLVAAAGAH